MNKYNKLLIGALTIFILSSCSKISDDLNTIEDESKIKEIANNIYNRQNEESFSNLNNFIVKITQTISKDEVNEEYKINSTKTITKEYSCDIDNFIIKDKYEESSSDGSSKSEEVIYYYDRDHSIFYKLDNTNGLKVKYVYENTTKEFATLVLYSSSLEYRTTIKNQDFLINIESKISELKTKKEEYEGKSDEYYNYKFGSNDDKSFQLKIESKDKYYYDDLEGYETELNNNIMRDDKESYTVIKSYINVKDSDGIYYINNADETITTYSYDNASISKPNVDEYTTIEQ